MKKNLLYIRYRLLCVSFMVAALFMACGDDDKATNYLDDNAYPPPTVSLTSETSYSEVDINTNKIVEGTVTAPNGLRNIYGTLLRKTADGYEEIDANKRVHVKLAEFPNTYSFSIEVPVNAEDAGGIAIVANDIYVKQVIQNISIEKITGIPPKITTNPAAIESVELNGSVSLEGVVSSIEGLKSLSYGLVQKSPYLELQDVKNIAVSNDKEKSFQFSLVVDDERVDAIMIKAVDIRNVEKVHFVDIKGITGIPPGRAYIFDNVEMAPEWENPGDPNQPYIFSIDGVNVNGTVKNVLSLNEAISASSGNVDFMFANIWRNQTNFAYTAQRGFAFVGASRLNGGPVGRQQDAQWLTTMTLNLSNFKIITDVLATSMDLDNFFEDATGNWQTFEALDGLKSYLAASTATTNNLVMWRQGASTDQVDACSHNIKQGTYVAFNRRNIDGEFKWGIIKVLEAPDDSDALKDGCKIDRPASGNGMSAHYSASGLAGFDYSGVTKLYGRKCKLKIIVQR